MIRVRLLAFEDLTAGATDVLPEVRLHARLFASEHIERGARGTRSVALPSRTAPRAVDAAVEWRVDGELSRAACIGVQLYAETELDTPRSFLVPVGGATLYVTEPGERTVELIDFSDREAGGFVKGRLRVDVRVDAPVRGDAARMAATRENYDALQARVEGRIAEQLGSYARHGLVASTASVTRTHVVRYITPTSGRQLMAVYFLARRFHDADAPTLDAYWEGALRCALEISRVPAAAFRAWPTDAPQRARIVAQAATLYANAGVVYVNDHNNRGAVIQGRKRRRAGADAAIIDVERFIDPLVTRGGDCEDVAALTYWLLRHLYTRPPAADDSLLAHAARTVRAHYVPVGVVGEAVDPGAPERASIDEYGADELICHFYTMLLPTHFLVAGLQRAGHTDVVQRAPDARRAEPVVCEGTMFQCGLIRPYGAYDARAPPLLAAARQARHAAVRAAPRSAEWLTPLRIADAAPFYGRAVLMMSDVFHETAWCFAVARTNREYGVPMGELGAMRADIIFEELTQQRRADMALSRDVLAQCEPLVPPRPGAPLTLPAHLARLHRPPPPPPAGDFFVEAARATTYVWPTDAPPTDEDVAALEALAAEYAYVDVRIHSVSAGTDPARAGGVSARPVGVISIQFS